MMGRQQVRFATLARGVAAALVLALGTTAVFAQEYLVRSYSAADGLPVSAADDLGQDHSGVMWFATRAGIVSYDGVSWTSYANAEALAGHAFARLAFDSRERPWAYAPFPDNLVAMRDERGWRTFRGPQELANDRGAAVIGFDLGVWADGEEMPVLAFAAKGVFLYAAGSWQRLRPGLELPGRLVRGIACWGGDVIVATDEGIVERSRGGTLTSLNAALPAPDRDILAIGWDTPGFAPRGGDRPDLWVLTRSTLGRLRGSDYVPSLAGLDLPARSGSDRASLVVDGPRAVYYGTPLSLLRLPLDSEAIERLGTFSGLSGEGSSALLQDREGNLWVAGPRGVDKLVSRRFATYRQRHGLLEDEVTAICEPSPGRLVLGHPHGLTRADGSTFRAIPFGIEELPSYVTRTMDLVATADGTVWIAGSHLGVGRLGPSGAVAWRALDADESAFCLIADGPRSVLVGTSAGLLSFDGTTIRRIIVPGLERPLIRRLARAADGTVYIATAVRGALALSGGRARGLETPGDALTSSIFTVFIDRSGRLLAGSSVGLLELSDGRLRRPTAAALKFAWPVYSIAEDTHGGLWLGTDRGVVRWDGSAATCYTPAEGLSGFEANRAAALVDSSGRVWLGSDRGVSVFQGEDRGVTVPPVVEISGVLVGDREHDPSAPLAVTYGRNLALTVRFFALSFLDERRVHVRHRLLGLHGDWTDLAEPSQRQVRYTGLSPGEYRFEVQAANAAGVWSGVVATPAIVVRAPVYLQPWFVLAGMAALAFAALVVGRIAVRWRYAAALESAVERRTAALAAVSRVARHVAARLDLDELLRESVHETLGAFGCYNVTLLLLDRESGTLGNQVMAGAYAPIADPQYRQRVGEGLIGEAAATGTTICSRDVRSDPRYLVGFQRPVATVSECAVPLRLGGEVLGVLDVQNTKADAFDAATVQALETVADQVAISINNARLYAEATRELAERRRVEAALMAGEEQLRQAQKMEAIGRLAGGVAHDFNNLLQAMLAIVEGLRLRPRDEHPAAAVDELVAHIQRAAALTRQLLLFSRREVASREEVDLNELVDDTTRLLRRLIPETVHLVVVPAASPPAVLADRGQLQQVLLNLAVNARDAMAHGGSLTVRTENDGGECSLVVEDTGTGMDAATKQRIFEPFFTTKSEALGTGLGLAVVHGIVQQHGGRIEVESEVGAGSRFRIILPTCPRTTPEAAIAERRQRAVPPGGGERLLVVEDEDGARIALGELLRALGYDVTTVASGTEAIGLPDDPPFELVLSDLVLPGISGAALVPILEQRWPGLRVVLMSGYTEDAAVRYGVVTGSVRFLQKPFDLATVAREIREALDERPGGPENVEP